MHRLPHIGDTSTPLRWHVLLLSPRKFEISDAKGGSTPGEMRMIFCCTCFDHLMCFWVSAETPGPHHTLCIQPAETLAPRAPRAQASRHRKPLVACQFVLQGVVLLMLMFLLIVSSSSSYDVVTSFPRCRPNYKAAYHICSPVPSLTLTP